MARYGIQSMSFDSNETKKVICFQDFTYHERVIVQDS